MKVVNNEMVMNLTSAKFNKHDLTVKDIDDTIVKYASMMIAYKIHYTNIENIVSTTIIHTVHQMVKEFLDIDLCELLRQQLMENMQTTKK